MVPGMESTMNTQRKVNDYLWRWANNVKANICRG
jgi:hypothetical protein